MIAIAGRSFVPLVRFVPDGEERASLNGEVKVRRAENKQPEAARRCYHDDDDDLTRGAARRTEP